MMKSVMMLWGMMVSGWIFATAAMAQVPLNVVTTIGQITDMVEVVGGEQVAVTGLMGPGVDPHLYKASEGDVGRLNRADIIFYNGLFLEGQMEEVFEKIQRFKPVYAITDDLDHNLLLDHEDYENHYDPHVWFDLTLWLQTVSLVSDKLQTALPNHAEQIAERAKAYQKQINDLHIEITQAMQTIPEQQRVLVTAHDAFRYFGQRYGLEVYGLQGVSTQSEAGTRDVMALADFISDRKIPAIFVESSIPERMIRAVQEAVRARGWDVKIGGELFSDAMGDAGTIEGTYIGMIRHNVRTIVDALGGTYDEPES